MSPRSANGIEQPGPIPARAGIGLRSCHHDDWLQQRPTVGWLEAHSENYFANGGAQLDALNQLRALYPLSLHGVGLSIGSTDAWNSEHLRKLKRLISWSEPVFVSEHLSWGSVDGIHVNDLLPLPHTEEALRHMVRRVSELQDFLGRSVLIENVSSYLRFNGEQLAEWEFLSALAQEARCGLLLDINNIYVNARNHGFDAHTYLANIPCDVVKEMHLAGHTVNHYNGREILIDTHSAPVCDAVWQLYRAAIERFGPTPTLIEWDSDIPALEVLVAETRTADHHQEQVRAIAA